MVLAAQLFGYWSQCTCVRQVCSMHSRQGPRRLNVDEDSDDSLSDSFAGGQGSAAAAEETTSRGCTSPDASQRPSPLHLASYLWKKSSGRSFFGRRNWLRRWFELDPFEPCLWYAPSPDREEGVSLSCGSCMRSISLARLCLLPHRKRFHCLVRKLQRVHTENMTIASKYQAPLMGSKRSRPLGS